MGYDESAASGENPSDVWSNGYIAVYHLSEVDGTTWYDSTSHNNHGTGTSGLGTTSSYLGQGVQVDAVYRIALSRQPSDEERSLGVETLKKLESKRKGQPQMALETYCHTILNSAAFIFVD